MGKIREKYLKYIELWSCQEKPKPLLLYGGRQVGKTHLMTTAAKSLGLDSVYINFEKDKTVASLFSQSLSPESILSNLALYLNRPIARETTLIIFDEVQESPDALNSLKYFAESPDRYLVLAAGSLLGVKRSKKGFPVGQVQFLDVYPLSFLEFLEFVGQSSLRKFLEELPFGTALPDAFHSQLLRLQREYCWTGGMPAAVSAYADNNSDFDKVREIQDQILSSYQLDFAKHAPAEMVVKISRIFAKIPQILAKENKKFVYSEIGKNARARDYYDSLQWLVDARIVHIVHNVSQVDLPLAAQINESVYKIYLIDVGLLGCLFDVPSSAILDQESLFHSYKGALAESFVGQELVAYGTKKLFYWSSSGTAEVDFIVQSENRVFPVEVKSGLNMRSKSLISFGERYSSNQLIRCSTRNFDVNGKFLNYPLYAVSNLSKDMKRGYESF